MSSDLIFFGMPTFLSKNMSIFFFLGGYEGDTYMLLKLLLPGVVKRVYNLNNKQLVKLFSQVRNNQSVYFCSNIIINIFFILLFTD